MPKSKSKSKSKKQHAHSTATKNIPAHLLPTITKDQEDCLCEKTAAAASVLHQSLYDKSLPPPPRAPAPYCQQRPSSSSSSLLSSSSLPRGFNMSDLANMEVDKVLIEYRFKDQAYHSSNRPRITHHEVSSQGRQRPPLEAPKRVGVCEGLKLAGFQKDWTKEKVARLLATPDGAELVKKVDMEYRQMTGKASLSEKDILSCYPDYLRAERRNVELLLELDSKENILSVREKGKSKGKSQLNMF
jgi:hypothetical protein